MVRETFGSGTTAKILDFVYDESGRPFALIYTNGTADSVTYYYVLNLQGDVVGLIDASGTYVAQYTYNAWGKILTGTGDMASINPLRYRGYYYDSETGFYYLQSRYYDPENHRFINADGYASTGQGFIGTNMFAYCLNNPVMYEDYLGTFGFGLTINTIGTDTGTGGGGGGIITLGLFYEFGYVYSSSSFSKNRNNSNSSLGSPNVRSAGNTASPSPNNNNDDDDRNQKRSLPKKGKPNSDSELLNPDGSVKQRRHYDSNGDAEYDIDFKHGGTGHKFPHKHPWENGQRLDWVEMELY